MNESAPIVAPQELSVKDKHLLLRQRQLISERKYRAKHPERRRKSGSEYYKRNIVEIRKKHNDYTANHKEERKEYWKNYYQENKERETKRKESYRSKTRERAREWQRRYWRENRERLIPIKIAALGRRRSMIYGGSTKEEIKSAEIRIKELRGFDCFVCEYCRNEFKISRLHIDHKIPISKGGRHSSENIAASCDKCNLSKSNKISQEWHNISS